MTELVSPQSEDARRWLRITRGAAAVAILAFWASFIVWAFSEEPKGLLLALQLMLFPIWAPYLMLWRRRKEKHKKALAWAVATGATAIAQSVLFAWLAVWLGLGGGWKFWGFQALFALAQVAVVGIAIKTYYTIGREPGDAHDLVLPFSCQPFFILIIAAIAIPNLGLTDRNCCPESAAASTLRTLGTAEISYLAAYTLGFAPTLTALGPPAAGVQASVAAADLLDSVLSGGDGGTPTTFTKGGYKFTYAATPAGCVATVAGPNCSGFTITAVPQIARYKGQSSFFTDQTGVIRRETTLNVPATVGSPVL